jgi:hypothetical protein
MVMLMIQQNQQFHTPARPSLSSFQLVSLSTATLCQSDQGILSCRTRKIEINQPGCIGRSVLEIHDGRIDHQRVLPELHRPVT